MTVDGYTIKLTAREVLLLMQALRIATEDGSLLEYGSQHQINQLRERLSNAK